MAGLKEQKGSNPGDAAKAALRTGDGKNTTPFSFLDSVRAGRLVEVLGSELAAYALRLPETSLLREWMEGVSKPSQEQLKRLNVLYDVTINLQSPRYNKDTIQAWMQGPNQALGDVSPATVIREAKDLSRARADVMAAVSNFLANGL